MEWKRVEIVCLHDSVRLVCDWAGLGGRGGDDVHDSKKRAGGGTKINRSTLNEFERQFTQKKTNTGNMFYFIVSVRGSLNF